MQAHTQELKHLLRYGFKGIVKDPEDVAIGIDELAPPMTFDCLDDKVRGRSCCVASPQATLVSANLAPKV
jgi:hypothetical protein